MPEVEKPAVPPVENQFQKQAEEAPVGIVREFLDFLRYNKAWWLTPIIIVLLLVGGALYLGTIGAAPFIYTLF
jgi:hypothetical protein